MNGWRGCAGRGPAANGSCPVPASAAPASGWRNCTPRWRCPTGTARRTSTARAVRWPLDGARIWGTSPYLGHELTEIAALADTVYVSFYKTLGGISGAALAGPADLIAQARAWRHRYGGMLYQQWPAALAALAGLDAVLPRIPGYVRHARTVAEALAGVPGARVHPEPPHTHQFQGWLPHP